MSRRLAKCAVVAACLACALSPRDALGQGAEYHSTRGGLVDHAQVGLGFGYLFGFDVETTSGEVGFDGGLSYQLEGDIRIPSNTLIVVNYTWLPTELSLERLSGEKVELSDLDLHFFQVGAQREFLYGQIRPFMTLTLGATLFSANRLDDEWKFSTILGAGVKYLPTPKFGIRAQSRLLSSFATTSSGIFCGYAGCDYGLTGGSILHVEFSGVLFWVF